MWPAAGHAPASSGWCLCGGALKSAMLACGAHRALFNASGLGSGMAGRLHAAMALEGALEGALELDQHTCVCMSITSLPVCMRSNILKPCLF